ncbi:SbcC/MukB-like Walker B domain-containing protein [Sphingobacterium cellulitidis]|uniref:Nuclease SbcCD subunit C n=1 Tax=Sphingobacterium cellulitidis TaxID=1768011 RepID=A0A8H9G1D0_9SPHI|nr:SMC family ATPase [Sphingobacterium soli]MBA8988037.1 exonuclease SbcC [Sphingobacterium soli]GGE28936.1 nuclease SbcCD subunit C [Sphingobacterium soli]
MLPLYLSIEGLYSYQEKQSIDFAELTEAGLFGIFGNVGSGKSSILEAISFVLYGDTERLNKTDKRAYNMMNLKSNQTMIVFEFLNFEKRKFRFVAQWKRRKNFDDTTPIERTAYEWIDGDWIPLESADGALLTNLSYANFRRTIIIPQGQFKEFLELKGKDRSEMMKEIFYLNKFDLGPKVGFLQAGNNRKLENLKGALSGFESISTEVLNQKKLEVEEAKKTLEQTKNDFQELQVKVQSLQEYKDKGIELHQKEGQFKELNSKKERVQQQEADLNRYERTSQAFKEPLNFLQSLNLERESLIHKIENFQIVKERQLQEIDAVEKEIAAIQHDYLNLNIFRAQTEDYRKLIQIKENEKKEKELETRLLKGTPFVERTKEGERNLAKKLEETEERLETVKSDKVDTSQLIEMEKWYHKKDTMDQQQKQSNRLLEQLTGEIEEEQRQFNKEGYTEENWEQMIGNELKLIESDINKLRDQETHLQVQAKLSRFATELQPGMPCPLCGALEHPEPMLANHVQDELQKIHQEKLSLEEKRVSFQKQKELLTRISFSLNSKRSSLAQIQQDIEGQSGNLSNHLSTFSWAGYSSDDTGAFEAQKERIKQSEQITAGLESEVKQLRLDLQKSQDNIQKFEKELDSIKAEIAILQGVNAHSKESLQQLDFDQFKDVDYDELKQSKLHLDQKVIQVESGYLTLNQKLNTLKTKLAEIAGQYGSAKDQLSNFNQQIKVRQEQLAKLLREYNFADITQVQQIIQRPMPVEQMRKEIQQFYVRLEVLETQINSLKEFLKDKEFSEEELDTNSKLFEFKKEELELQLALTGGLEKELAHLTLEIGKKEKLLEEFEQLSARGANLKVLENLFKGNGFVNYVSSIHLRQMCEMANERFHRLTRNQLSLAVNENNEFEVIDYLNNGYRRSVKTLSGGQSFQASLCLALALAENIQSLNKSDRNFFFIDEGFGTQDSESINTVFDTLQYLHHENRVVGIISHVEELKERIPRSVTVEKDPESGSKAKASWN